MPSHELFAPLHFRAQAFRLVRVINYFPWNTRNRTLVKTWFHCFRDYFWLELLHWLFMWCMAVIAAYICTSLPLPHQFRLGFDTLFQSLTTAYVYSTGFAWQYYLAELYKVSDWFKIVYSLAFLVLLFMFGLFMMPALFVTVQLHRIWTMMQRAITTNSIHSEYLTNDPRLPALTQLIDQSQFTLSGSDGAQNSDDADWESAASGEGMQGLTFAPDVDPIGRRTTGAADDLQPYSGASPRVADFVLGTAFRAATHLNIVAHCVFVALVNDKARDGTKAVYTVGLVVCLLLCAIETALKVRAARIVLRVMHAKGPRCTGESTRNGQLPPSNIRNGPAHSPHSSVQGYRPATTYLVACSCAKPPPPPLQIPQSSRTFGQFQNGIWESGRRSVASFCARDKGGTQPCARTLGGLEGRPAKGPAGAKKTFTPSHMPQNDRCVVLIIESCVCWGKNVFEKTCCPLGGPAAETDWVEVKVGIKLFLMFFKHI